MQATLRCLYICYLSLDDPLVHSQVVAYLEGLARRGHTVHLLTFDTPLTPSGGRSSGGISSAAGSPGIRGVTTSDPRCRPLSMTPRPGRSAALRIMRRHRLDAVHARNHVPAAMALIVKRLSGCRMIFDLRGLMAEEYVDAGNWKRGAWPTG